VGKVLSLEGDLVGDLIEDALALVGGQLARQLKGLDGPGNGFFSLGAGASDNLGEDLAGIRRVDGLERTFFDGATVEQKTVAGEGG
jgi:hypothetical protein